jgi:hypothetical protein
MQHTSNPSSSEPDVRVLYRYPNAHYTNLGTFNFVYRYHPGAPEPSVADALPSLKADVLSVGGNAFIVRDQGLCQVNKGCVSVSTEVLRVDWPTLKREEP